MSFRRTVSSPSDHWRDLEHLHHVWHSWAPNTTVVIPNIASTGESSIIAYAANANFGMAGAVLAVFFTKQKQNAPIIFHYLHHLGVFIRIVEPAIYGLGVKLKTPLVAGLWAQLLARIYGIL
ncbi:hypothetical protein ACFOLK_18775 [Marinococcus halophilus]|uniref:hypothetical protein n=1 Tax=Marinococcus halophilus TaxID=1371 RepID=UPI003611F4E4